MKKDLKSEAIIRKIEAEILQGKLYPGTRFYSAREMMMYFDTSLQTANRISKKLASEKIIYLKNNVGYFVAPFAVQEIIKKRKNLAKQLMDVAVWECMDAHMTKLEIGRMFAEIVKGDVQMDKEKITIFIDEDTISLEEFEGEDIEDGENEKL